MAEIVDHGAPLRASRHHHCYPERTWREMTGNTEPGEGAVLLCDCGTVWRYHYFFDSPVGWAVANAWLSWRTRRWAKRARRAALSGDRL